MTGLDYAEPALDEIVAGKYRITRLIGRGGMGSVWEGVHLTLGNKVAVKFIDPAYAESPEARQRFENEARAAARLNSKYAVQVYDHGMMPDGRPFIVMEFLVGEPLDARLDRDGRISPIETARILSQVCRALSRAHSAGIIHRDLKPENVFLVWDEEDNANVAKVVDFGIAKFTDNQLGISSSTRTGSVLGTPYYMSPEQARGLRTIDYRTDLWALGVIAYRCMVGQLPFDGESVGDLLVKICTAPLPVPSESAPECPPGFDAWFARALQREPGERFVTAQELAEHLMIVCGVGDARQPFPSGQLGYAAEPGTHQGVYLAGQVTPGAGVPGVTAQQVIDTDAVFAQTRVTAGQKSRTMIWIAGGGIAAVGLAALVTLLMARPQPSATEAIGREGTSISSVRAVSPAPPSWSPGITVEPASTAGVAAAAAAPSTNAPSPTPSAQSQGRRAPPMAARPSAPRAKPPALPVQRPSANRPIDVGY